MRIYHLGDLHLSSGRRFADTCKALNWIVDDALSRGVELWIVGGDLTGTADVPHTATVQERNFLADLFQRMGNAAPTVILGGNHDSVLDLEIYGRLEASHPIHVVTVPTVLRVRVNVLDPDNACSATLYCLPFQHKRELLTDATGSIRDQIVDASDVLRAVLAGWAQEPAPPGPRIGCAHYTIRGAHLAGDEVMANKEVELTSEDLDAFGVDYWALSHLHLFQRVATRAWYAGSPTSQTFGETDEKGCIAVDVEPGAEPIITRRPTPARRLVTVQARWVQAGGAWQWLADPAHDLAAVPEGAEVRLQVEIPEEAATSCPVDELKARFDDVAHTVVLERKYVPKQRVRSETIRSAQTNTDRLEAWWECLGTQAPKADQRDRLFAKLALAEQDVAGVVVAEADEEAAA